jgi:hypothetical protein
MANLSKDEILRKIRNLEDKIHDCKAYIVSDFCMTCKEMYDQIHKHEIELKTLKDLISTTHND